jgi:hypothetical protein
VFIFIFLISFFLFFQDSFQKCAEFYGENAKSSSPSSFFKVLNDFVTNFQHADKENLERRKAEEVRFIFIYFLLAVVICLQREVNVKV